MLPHGARQRDEHGMLRLARVHRVEFPAPPREQAQALRRVADLVAEIVRPAAERIDVVEILMQMLGQQEADDVKVLVMGGGEPARVGERLRLASRSARAPQGTGRSVLGARYATPAYGNDRRLHVAVVAHQMAHHFEQVGQRLFAVDEIASRDVARAQTDSSAFRICIGV